MVSLTPYNALRESVVPNSARRCPFALQAAPAAGDICICAISTIALAHKGVIR